MTPAEHLEAAEKAIATSQTQTSPMMPEERQRHVLTAIAHALIANAVEGGVPHGVLAPPAS